MKTKSQILQEEVFKRIDPLSSYSDKHSYLNDTIIDAGKHGKKRLSDVIKRFPEVQNSINEYMTGYAIGEYGNPEDTGYTFSKDYSDKKILQTLDLIIQNEETIESKYGGQQGFKDMTSDVKSRASRIDDLKKEKKLIQKSIFNRRKEFDETAHSGGPLMELVNAIQQMSAGWTDIYQQEGMEKIERRNLMYDPDEQRFGLGPEYHAQQDKLKSVLNEIQKLSEINKEYAAYKQLDEKQNENLAMISGTIVYDLIEYGYATEDQIRALLGE